MMRPLDEQWKIITNDMVNGVVENRYAISNYGLIQNIVTGAIVGGHSLMSADNRSLTISKNRLVYMAFVNPIIPKGNKILFLDNNPNNLYYKNLVCVTHQEFRNKTFEMNAINNANATFEHMSSRDYYSSSNKIMYYRNDEEWRDITDAIVPGINPWYLISQYGRIYSKATDSIVKQAVLNSGYMRVQLIQIK